MSELILSQSLFSGLQRLAAFADHPWWPIVEAELRPQLSAPHPLRGSRLSHVLTVLIRQGCATRPEIPAQFAIDASRLQYSPVSHSYTIELASSGMLATISFGFDVEHVGRCSIAYLIEGERWSYQSETIPDTSKHSLRSIAIEAGEIVGQLDNYRMLPAGSNLSKANEVRVAASMERAHDVRKRLPNRPEETPT